MTRAFALMLVALFLTAVTGTFSVMLGLASVPVVPGLLIVAYVAIVDGPLAAAVSAALVGLAMDALAGTPLGVNVLACVAVVVVSRFFIGWVPVPRGVPSLIFVFAMSSAHAFLCLLLLFLFQRREHFGVVGLISTGLANATASLAVFPIVNRLLRSVNLEDRVSLQERLASKG